MLQWSKTVSAALFTALLPLAAYADKVEILGGGFTFRHAPVDPEEPDGFCLDPPGLLFRVTSESFDGLLVTKKTSTPFTGIGNASGCAFFDPINGVAAEFNGSFSWQSADGELRGTFVLLDFPTEFEGVFAVVIFITFDGGTGRFNRAKGDAIAEGLDFPFGGLNGEPSAAGIAAEIIQGELKLKE